MKNESYELSDILQHGEHKYIAKIGEGLSAKYFYTQAELDAYKRGISGRANSALNGLKQKTAGFRQELGAYGKALSSRDEKKNVVDTYNKTYGENAKNYSEVSGNMGMRKQIAELDNASRGLKTYENKGVNVNGKYVTNTANSQRQADDRARAEAYNKMSAVNAADNQYKKAKSISGKIEAVKSAYHEYHPDTDKKLNASHQQAKSTKLSSMTADASNTFNNLFRAGRKAAGNAAVNAATSVNNAAYNVSSKTDRAVSMGKAMTQVLRNKDAEAQQTANEYQKREEQRLKKRDGMNRIFNSLR